MLSKSGKNDDGTLVSVWGKQGSPVGVGFHEGRSRGGGNLLLPRLGPIMIFAWHVFPKPIKLTTEVRIHLTFLSMRPEDNLLLVRKNHALLPTLPLFGCLFLKLLYGMALQFRSFGHRLIRKVYPLVMFRRGFRNCRVICHRSTVGRPVVEVRIDVSPPTLVRIPGSKSARNKLFR